MFGSVDAECPPWDDDPLSHAAAPPAPPEEPAWLRDLPELDPDVLAGEVDAWLAGLEPAGRFAAQYGRAPTANELDRFAPPSLERSVALQDLAVQTARVRALADGPRILSLLDAHDASIADLTVRFGAKIAAAEGMGGTAFATSIALLTRTDPRQVKHEIHAGSTLRDRLPATWAVFQAGDTTWARAQKAVTQADGLDAEHWPAYDAKAAGIVATSTRVRADLRRARELLQAGTGAARARTTFQRRTTILEPGVDSGVAWVIEGLATTWLPRHEAVQRLAIAAHGTDTHHRTVAQLRHDITERIFDLGLTAFRASAATGAEVVPATSKVKVNLTLTIPVLGWLGVTTEQAILSGYGPISMELAKQFAGTATSMTRVMTDPVTGVRVAMDRTTYTPPVDLARWVRIRDGRTRFPGKSTPAHLADIDHAREWHHGGPTEDTNLITLDRPSHNAKTAGLYQDQLFTTGTVGITDPWGRRFTDPPHDPMDPAPPHHQPPPTETPDAAATDDPAGTVDEADDPCPF